MRDLLFDREYQDGRNDLNEGIDRLIGTIGNGLRQLAQPRPKRRKHRPGLA